MNNKPIPNEDELSHNDSSLVYAETSTETTAFETQKPPEKKKRIYRRKKTTEDTSLSASVSSPKNPTDMSGTSIEDSTEDMGTVPASNTTNSTIEIAHIEIPARAETHDEETAYTSTIRRIYNRCVSLYSNFKPTEKIVFILVCILACFSGLTVLKQLNTKYSVELPTYGGTYTEGVVGYARFINPLLGYTDADKDLISLIYSGLLRPTPEGTLVADLAKSWTISDDGLVYDFIIRDDAYFHDGKPVTTDDIEFTIQKALDPQIKSPKAENWAGVKVEKINPKEIRFTLKKPYSPFLENMTLGILPKHIWSDINHEAFDVHIRNREPIGSGPYKVKKAVRNDTGIYEQYELSAFDRYTQGKPYISTFIVLFFKNEAEALSAYSSGKINALGGVSPEEATKLKRDSFSLTSTPLPRVFGIFFNQSSAPVLVHKEVREALSVSIDRFKLIDSILKGWGTIARSPIPGSLISDSEIHSLSNGSSTEQSISEKYIEAGKDILTSKGWKQNSDGIFEKQTKSGKTTTTERLAFTISTSNVPELKHSAEILKETWTKMGVDVKVEIFEPSDLTQKVIRPREYNSLLFGNVVGRDFDLYPFWHSSQRNDPGLNIALYTNIKADKALETIRTTSDESKKLEQYRVFESEVKNDIPAIFLYSPDYIYATDKQIHNLNITNITSPSERFMNVHTWYIDTERVWNIFANKN